MPSYVIHLACGHHRLCTYRKPPPFLVPTETAWTLSWCPVCDHTQKVTDVRPVATSSGPTSSKLGERHNDGSGCG